MRSAVNIQGLPQAIVPDNRHVIGVAKSIGSSIQQGMERRKAESNKERAAAIARELVSGGVGEGLPEAIRPQLDPQAELQSQAVELQRQKQVEQAQAQAEQAQKALTQRSNMQSMLNDPETKANLIELQSLDPQMARTVFTMLASADEQERLQVAQEAQRDNDMFQNAAYFLQQDIAKKGGGDQFKAFVADAIRQEHARGADTTKLQELYRANPDEAIGLIQRNLALSGTVLKNPKVESIILADGSQLVNKQTGEVIATNEKEAAPMSEYQEASLRLERRRLAAEQEGKTTLSTSDLNGINRDVSKMVKPVNEIHAAAKSLAKLKETSSPTDQVAAVFKFMKTLDPSSTVRDSELGMVYSAEGAAAGLAAKLNQLMGEGGITPENFTNLVATANSLANSEIESANQQLEGFLGVFDNLPNNKREKLFNRIPKSLGATSQQQPLNITVDY